MYSYIFAVVSVLALMSVCTGQGPVTISPPYMNCKGVDACSCQFEDGTMLNLTQLSRSDNVPHFANISDGQGDFYSWNPCKPFTYKSNTTECENVAVCMIRHGFPVDLYYSLGTEDSAEFSTDDNGTLTLTYTADKGEFKRMAQIKLQCMETSKFDFFVAQGEEDLDNITKIYRMVLGSKWACGLSPNINPATVTTDDDDGLGGGVIFVIVLASLVGAYIVFGMAYQGIVKGEKGVRMFPNHEIWCNLPGIKGACNSSSESGLSSGKGAKYDSI